MFVLCTHCQFLVTVDPVSGAPPTRCPRCRGLVAPVPAGSAAASDDLSAAMAELAPPAVVASKRVQATAARADVPDGGGAASSGLASAVADAKTRLPWNASAAQPIDVAPANASTTEGSNAAAASNATAAVAAGDAPAVDMVTSSPAGASDDAPAPEVVPDLPAADAPSRIDVAVGTPGDGADLDCSAGPGDETAAQARDADVHAAAVPGEASSSAVAAPALDDAPRPASEQAPAMATPAMATPAAAPSATPARPRKRTPAWLRRPRFAFAQSARFRRWRAPVAIAALTVLLVLQMLLADRAQLAADAQWRPSMQVVCGVLGCDLPPWRQPEAFRLVERNVAADPERPGVLKVRARFRNDARWSQPWPAIALTLSDADGRTLGARVFTPGEYLAIGTTQNGIASGQLATVSIDVVEPAPGVVAFTFEFH
jgi:hypothetical protein